MDLNSWAFSPSPHFGALSTGLHTSTSPILTHPSPAPAHRSISNVALRPCQGTKAVTTMSHQVRGFSQPDRRVPQLLSHPLDVSNGSRGRRPLRSPPSDKKLQPLTGPMMARRSLNLLCNNLLGFLSISTCSVFSSERKHECETTTPCSNQTTALPTCLGLRVGEGMFSKLSSMSQLWLPE